MHFDVSYVKLYLSDLVLSVLYYEITVDVMFVFFRNMA